MSIRRLKLFAALLLAAGAVALAQESVFKVDVRLVRLLATVKDSSGQLIGSLRKGDFTIYDSGVRQEVAVFEQQTEQPLSVTLLLDASGSTAAKLREGTDSVLRFLKRLFGEGNPGDSVSLYSFNQDVTLETSFTRRMARIERELRTIKAEAGTSLYDAIYFASQALEDREGRRVIVIVSDGADTTSSKTFHEALRAANSADAVMYGIMIVPVASDAGRHVAGENALTTLAVSTGGRVFAAGLGAALDDAFADILRDLRTQYLIGYYPKNLPYSKERFRRIELKVNRPDLRVLTRSGYYVEYEDSAR
ncbi:MAG: VWA domain-containing protein [Bryobacteraceae bacterium]|nr:VWA domain-containing protein [Bryobacteraceae bacterium]